MVHPAESTHWYDKQGLPKYEVEAAKGGMRPTTLRDARKHGYMPSVTSIMRLAAAPGLEIWKRNQLLMSAFTLPRLPDEQTEAFMDRVVKDAEEQGKKARERGTAIHAALEGGYQGEGISVDYVAHWVGTEKAVNEWVLIDDWQAEKSFSSPLGFGGKCDLSHGSGFVADFKTTEKDLATIKTWPEHAWQLAAYREGLGMPQARCAIVYVHVASAGAKVIELSEDELKQGWDCFRALLAFWQASKGYKP